MVPSTASAAVTDTPSGTFVRSEAATMACSRQPVRPITRSPGAKSGLAEAITRPPPLPGIIPPISTGAM